MSQSNPYIEQCWAEPRDYGHCAVVTAKIDGELKEYRIWSADLIQLDSWEPRRLYPHPKGMEISEVKAVVSDDKAFLQIFLKFRHDFWDGPETISHKIPLDYFFDGMIPDFDLKVEPRTDGT